jgi:hypothetical protein
MGVLNDIGLKYGTDKATFHKYLDFYQRHLPDRSFKGRLLEIGVMDGNSMRMWREYYPDAEIVGIDTGLQWDLKIDGVTLLELDGTDPKQTNPLGMFDIIIDDASHYTADQQKSFEHLFYNQLTPGGLYVLEDLHTSFRPEFVNSKIDTIEYINKLTMPIQRLQRGKKSMTAIIGGAA